MPVHPELVTLFRDHLDQFGTGPNGHVFTGTRAAARRRTRLPRRLPRPAATAFGETEATTPLMGSPYDLRHAAVSTWLNAGVPAAAGRRWAGHSVDVLLRVYAKCISGQQDEAKWRIEDAMGQRKTAVKRQQQRG